MPSGVESYSSIQLGSSCVLIPIRFSSFNCLTDTILESRVSITKVKLDHSSQMQRQSILVGLLCVFNAF